MLKFTDRRTELPVCKFNVRYSNWQKIVKSFIHTSHVERSEGAVVKCSCCENVMHK